MKIPNQELHRITPTAIIYNKEGKFLIVRRSLKKKVLAGRWHVPGGGLEIDDYIRTKSDKEGQWYGAVEKCLRREVEEETGLKMGKIEYLLDLTFVRPDNIPVLVLSFYAPYKSGKVKLCDDNIDFAWVSRREAKKYDLVAGILDELKMVDKILKKRKR